MDRTHHTTPVAELRRKQFVLDLDGSLWRCKISKFQIDQMSPESRQFCITRGILALQNRTWPPRRAIDVACRADTSRRRRPVTHRRNRKPRAESADTCTRPYIPPSQALRILSSVLTSQTWTPIKAVSIAWAEPWATRLNASSDRTAEIEVFSAANLFFSTCYYRESAG